MEAWENFLKLQEADLGSATVLKWLHPLKIIRFDACNLYLEATDSFQISWFEEHIRPRILSSLYNNNKKKIRVHLSLARKDPSNKSSEVEVSRNKNAAHLQKNELIFDTIDPSFSFEQFIDPAETPLPFKLLSTIEGKESPPFNPIYLYGESGRGKTHLLMALTQRLRKQGLKVVYARADTFTEHVVAAIRAGEMRAFRHAYRNVDALIIDDVQVFARKAATQEEFFHTFNTLHLEGKLIVLAADCAPQALANIEPRLISRFEWGIALPLGALSHDELLRMLEKKAKAMNCPLSPQLLTFLLETFPSGTKSLTRALQALILRTHLDENDHHLPTLTISIYQAKVLLNDLIVEEQKYKLTPPKILQHVCDYFGLLPDDLLGKAQSRDRVLPRQIAMYLCRRELKLSFIKIGEFFSKDHSTVMSSVKLIQSGIESGNHDIIDPIEGIRKRFRSTMEAGSKV